MHTLPELARRLLGGENTAEEPTEAYCDTVVLKVLESPGADLDVHGIYNKQGTVNGHPWWAAAGAQGRMHPRSRSKHCRSSLGDG